MAVAEMSQRKRNAVKWILYSILLFVAFIFQTTVDLFQIFGVKPIWILPVIMYIAVFEGEWAGAIFGVVGGLFWDTAANKLLGFNAIILLVLTVCAALLSMYLIKANFWNSLLIVLAAALIQGLADYVFCYLIWGHSSTHLILIKKILPTVAYTTIAAVPLFFLVRKISRAFRPE